MEYINYIKPELLVLVPVLLAVGAFLKSAAFVSDKWIPLILGAAGIVLAALWVAATAEPDNWAMCIFTGVVQGVLCAAAAVYGNQIVKQLRDKP